MAGKTIHTINVAIKTRGTFATTITGPAVVTGETFAIAARANAGLTMLSGVLLITIFAPKIAVTFYALTATG